MEGRQRTAGEALNAYLHSNVRNTFGSSFFQFLIFQSGILSILFILSQFSSGFTMGPLPLRMMSHPLHSLPQISICVKSKD